MLAQIHLTVDTAMDTGSLSIAAYVARKLNLGEQNLARKFQEVECEIDTQEIETVGGVHTSIACIAQGSCRVMPSLHGIEAGQDHETSRAAGLPTARLPRARECVRLLAFREALIISSALEMLSLHNAVDTLKKDGAAPLPRDLDGLQKTLDRLQETLSRAHTYVEDVAVCPVQMCCTNLFVHRP